MEDTFSERRQMRRLNRQKKLIVKCSGGEAPKLHFSDSDGFCQFVIFGFSGSDNEIFIGKNCEFRRLTVFINGSHNRLYIGDGCCLHDICICFAGDSSTVRLGKRVFVNATRNGPTAFHIGTDTTLTVGDDAGLSNNTNILTTDYHGMYDGESHQRINPDKDTVIGNHVIVFMRSTVLKGTHIADGCSVGTSSVVSGNFAEPNCIIAGNPAKVVRRNVLWDYGKDGTLPEQMTSFDGTKLEKEASKEK